MEFKDYHIKETNKSVLDYKNVDWKKATLEDWWQFTKANNEFREPGISYDELRALHEACELLGHRPIRIVETGMCFGTTTRYFIVRLIKYGGELWSYEVKVRDLFKQKMEELDLWNYVNVHGDSMKDAYDNKRIDLMFIDSEHALENALCEYVRFRPFYYENTIIGFHDCDTCPGVAKAINVIQEMDELIEVSSSRNHLGAGVIFFKRKYSNRRDRPWKLQKGHELLWVEHPNQ